jgi:hypothetical protein
MASALFVDYKSIFDEEPEIWLTYARKKVLLIDSIEFRTIKSNFYAQSGVKIGTKVKYTIPKNFVMKVNKKDVDYSLFDIRVTKISYRLMANRLDELSLSNYDRVYFILPKGKMDKYMIEQLNSDLKLKGIKKFSYYLLTTDPIDFSDDGLIYKKTRLVLQHLSGYKTAGYKFTQSEITQYNDIVIVDEDYIHSMSDEIFRDTCTVLLSATEENLSKEIVDKLSKKCVLTVKSFTDNLVNRFITKQLSLISN